MAHSILGAAEVELQHQILRCGLAEKMPGRAPFRVRVEQRRHNRAFPLQAVVVDHRGKRVRAILPIPIKAGVP